MIKAMEVWVPDPTRSTLELQSGHYGDLVELRSVSEKKRFAFGSGLPGMAWAAGHPLITDSESDDFHRSAIARKSGISSVAALPIFAGDYLTGVLTILLSDADEDVGALEIWHCDLTTSYDLRLDCGHFGQLKYFESTARHTSFRQGTGLPGRAWEEGLPVLMDDLGHSHAFIRREGALRAGITTGLAFPVFHDPAHVYIVALLSSAKAPIARQIEVWERDPLGPGLTFRQGYGPINEDLKARYQKTQIAPREGMLGRALFSGVPTLSNNLERDTPVNPEAGLTKGVALPVIDSGRCRAVIALYD